MIAVLTENEYDRDEAVLDCRPRQPRSERLFRAGKLERSSRQKLADAARFGRRGGAWNGVHRRRLGKGQMA